jgi:hypothetical protein
VAINGYNKMEICLKTRRCKVDRRGSTTRENRDIVIWSHYVHPEGLKIPTLIQKKEEYGPLDLCRSNGLEDLKIPTLIEKEGYKPLDFTSRSPYNKINK